MSGKKSKKKKIKMPKNDSKNNGNNQAGQSVEAFSQYFNSVLPSNDIKINSKSSKQAQVQSSSKDNSQPIFYSSPSPNLPPPPPQEWLNPQFQQYSAPGPSNLSYNNNNYYYPVEQSYTRPFPYMPNQFIQPNFAPLQHFINFGIPTQVDLNQGFPVTFCMKFLL